MTSFRPPRLVWSKFLQKTWELLTLQVFFVAPTLTSTERVSWVEAPALWRDSPKGWKWMAILRRCCWWWSCFCLYWPTDHFTKIQSSQVLFGQFYIFPIVMYFWNTGELTVYMLALKFSLCTLRLCRVSIVNCRSFNCCGARTVLSPVQEYCCLRASNMFVRPLLRWDLTYLEHLPLDLHFTCNAEHKDKNIQKYPLKSAPARTYAQTCNLIKLQKLSKRN